MIKTPIEILSEVTHHPIEALQNESYTKVKYTFRAMEAYHNQFESIDKQTAVNFAQHLLKDFSTQEVTISDLNDFLNIK